MRENPNDQSALEGPGPTLPSVRYLGNYELIEEVARGGMGVVYKARQVTLNRDVAVKMILAGQLADENSVERFHAEAKAAAALHHPNIVAIHEIGEHEGQHYFSMDLVEGPSLDSILETGPLAPKRAAEYARTIAEAIHYAHEQGTLHRDLKPSNVLIDDQDRPRITDFGLAKRIEGDAQRTVTGAIVGTPSYMSPEQAAGKRGLIGPGSDVYSIGALLYELLTGRPPFKADSPIDTLLQVLEQDPVPPRVFNPNVPAELETICLTCLEKHVERRYRSARELAEDLQRFLDGEPIRARAANRFRRIWTWAKRHPWSITTVACTLVLGLLFTAYWFWSEKALWQYRVAHPDHVRERGLRTAKLDSIRRAFLPLLLIVAFLYHYSLVDSPLLKRVRRVPLLIGSIMTLGAICFLWGGYVGMKVIEAYVWENVWWTGGLFWAGFYAYVGSFFVMRMFHAYESQTSGTSLELTVQQEDDLYDLLSSGDKSDFRRRYKLAKAQIIDWTGADPLHAKMALARMHGELRTVHPDRVPPRFGLKALLMGGLIYYLFSRIDSPP